MLNPAPVMSSPAVPDSQPKFVQVDRHTYEVNGVREGGCGKVWLLKRRTENWDWIYGPAIAVKMFNVYEDEQEALVERELDNWISLQSRYIVSLIKIVRLNFELGALMLLMPGSLDDYLRGHGPLDTSTTKVVLLDVARGLADAQTQANLFHLDLKPQNLLPDSIDSPRVRISDWGISRIASQQRQHLDWLRAPRAWLARQTTERTKFAIGTPPYMAPERFSGSWKIGPSADVFSLGVIGIQLMTSQLPTVDPSGDISRIIDLIMSHRYFDRAKALMSARGGRLAALVLKMIEPNPDHRPTDYAALIAGLEAV
jgi:serine/threonine protein kinase